jgi:hypothetical protein
MNTSTQVLLLFVLVALSIGDHLAVVGDKPAAAPVAREVRAWASHPSSSATPPRHCKTALKWGRLWDMRQVADRHFEPQPGSGLQRHLPIGYRNNYETVQINFIADVEHD